MCGKEEKKTTKQEKIIVSAHTGVLMCDFDDVHEYIQEKLGRPVFTHELADKGVQKEVEEKSKEEFLEICNREEPERKVGKWIIRDNPGTGWFRVTCSECGEDVTATVPCIGFLPNAKVIWDYCPFCGARMMEGEEDEQI